ncbi:MAG: GtrA family protein [Pontixanthobacter sp.]
MRFGVVGVVQNGVSVILLIALTRIGLAPWQAFAIVFPLAILGTYWLNSRWTFAGRTRSRMTPIAYIATYGVTYVFTIGASYLLEWAGVAHWANVLVTIVAAGILSYVLLDLSVFRRTEAQSAER